METKTVRKPDPKDDSPKPDTQDNRKPPAKAVNAESAAKTDPQPNAKEAKPETKAGDAKSEAKAQPAPEAKSAPEPKAEPRPDAKSDSASVLNRTLGDILVAGMAKDPEDAGRLIAAAIGKPGAVPQASESGAVPETRPEAAAKDEGNAPSASAPKAAE